MRVRKAILAIIAVVAIGVAPAAAGPITVDAGWYEFGFGGAGTMAGSGAATVPTVPVSNIADDSPWTFSGAATFTVQDLFLSVDRFEVFDFGVSLGLTSAPVDGGACGAVIAACIADARYSRGTFNLGAGAHSITILHTEGIAGAAVFRADSVPEPASLVLLGAGLAGLAVKARRRRKA
jgi:hypothetical protein